MKISKFAFAAVLGLATLAAGYIAIAEDTKVVPISDLSQHTHIHGLAVDRNDPSNLLIATHHGVFRTRNDGRAERISPVNDYMGFSPHPTDPDVYYASGHPPEGGNLGFMKSTDAGRTWRQISPGANGPVDFHQITVSSADPNTIYGVYKGLQVSRDGGRTWSFVGPAPEKMIDLAASSKDRDTIYAGTANGLLMSKDAGKTWRSILQRAPVTRVKVTPAGTLYAFLIGGGLMRAEEPLGKLTPVSASFGESFVTFLASHPGDPSKLFAATHKGAILTSSDRGKTWSAFDKGEPMTVRREPGNVR